MEGMLKRSNGPVACYGILIHIIENINIGWLIEQYVIISDVNFTLNVNSDGDRRYICLTPE